MAPSASHAPVTIHADAGGWKLQVAGRDFMVLGMNWGYMPIGENYTYDFWGKSDAFIEAALAEEMGLLKAMGINAIRQYVGIPARWITYIHDTYGIYTMLNHPMGRYGHSIDGVWMEPTDYSAPRTREVIREEILKLARDYKDTRGLLMWLLGNENNYGLHWKSHEIEDLPADDQPSARAAFLYSLYGEVVDGIKAIDTTRPVAIANGDLQYIDLIAKHVKGLDILGTNVYRGASARDLYQKVKDLLGVPVMYTEFGSDAYNARDRREDHQAQAALLREQWQEIYSQSYGKGLVANCIGGFIFQWSDGWWKFGQTTNLDKHDNNASWENGGYTFDWVEGENNMNEEWFGIAAKGPRDERGLYRVTPRSAYYLLQEAFKLDPYAPGTDLSTIRSHFGRLDPRDFSTRYAADSAQLKLDALGMVRVSGLRMRFDTVTTGGARLLPTEPDPDVDGSTSIDRTAVRFDHQESFYADITLAPDPSLTATMSLSVVPHHADNAIDEIFWEDTDTILRVYQASVDYQHDWFELTAFYRKGHFHWAHEGDFFGLYPEANYQPAVDRYQANAPYGMVVTGRKALKGLKLAFGPELYWGANPALYVKYSRTFGDWSLTLIHHEDIARKEAGESSVAIPEPLTRRTTLHAATSFGPVKLDMGGIVAGSNRVGQRFTKTQDASTAESYADSGYDVLDDTIRPVDTLGAKAKVTISAPPLFWYVQGAYKGLVANGGADPTITFTGWRLKEDGRGNQWNVMTGAAFNIGDVQIAPNVLYQRPLVGPLPEIESFYSQQTHTFYPGTTRRDIRSSPFAVRGNREQLAAELMITWDPTPATWLWMWDNDLRENADIALSLDILYRHQPTSTDSALGYTNTGILIPIGAPPAKDVWEVMGRVVGRPAPNLRYVAHLWAGTGQANGADPRLVTRFGLDARVTYEQLDAFISAKINDWGPYDYHRDFNLTFPVQLTGDVAMAFRAPQWLGRLSSRIGLRASWRGLDQHSPRYTGDADTPMGNEWEIRTYLEVGIDGAVP